MVNRNVFFNHSYGMRTLAWVTKPEHGRHLLIIRYEVRSGRAVGEHEMLIPVPAEYLSLAEDTVRAWVSPASLSWKRRACRERMAAVSFSKPYPTIIPGLRSPSEKVGGIVYFGRMRDKIRHNAA